MTIFTSTREKYLWILTSILVSTIYATIGIASTLVGLVSNEEFVAAGFFLGMFLIGVAVVTNGLTTKPRLSEIAITIGFLGAYLIMFLRTTVPSARSHIIEYSLVALLIYLALLERKRNGRGWRFPGMAAIVATISIGVLDEVIQIFVPNRVFDPFDILFNSIASVLPVAGVGLLAWVRRVTDRELAARAATDE